MCSDFNASSYAVANSSTSSCISSRWLTEEVFRLIDIVQRDEAIYNPRHKYYFCRPYVENFWREVDLKLEKNPGASLAKWTNLRISFRREYTNYLEEKVPPCWSYFDRMFFLHPYLRKKHQQPSTTNGTSSVTAKSLDTQVQDALAQINTLSNRLQRERAVAAAAAAVNGPLTNNQGSSVQQPLENYLEYFDEHDANHSELDEIIDDEHHHATRYQNVLDSDIKSECEENVDDYESEGRHEHQHDDDDIDDDADDQDVVDGEIHDYVLDNLPPTSSSTSSIAAVAAATAVEKRLTQQQHQRLQHLNRLQIRAYHDDIRAKRPRSNDMQSNTNNLCSSQPHTNISLVRPTFAKPMDMVSTTTITSGNNAAVSNQAHESDLSSSSSSYMQTRHLSHHHHHSHRLDSTAINNASASAPAASTSITTTSSVGATSTTAGATHVELCDCKTDPDAMFLMSLLPDIQKLNGRDRGKIKIAFQNILQDYLYPD